MEKGEGWVRDQYSKCFTELGIKRNFHKLRNSMSTKNLKKPMIIGETSEGA